MWSRNFRTAGFSLLGFLCLAPVASTSQHKQNQREKEKSVWNYDGGVFFETDGSLPNGACFRVSGRLNAPNFFDNLKRLDTDGGTVFRRGSESVTQFPEVLFVSYLIRDQPCATGLEQVGPRVYLTQEMMNSLQLSIYWKHGVDLQPVKNIRELLFRVDRITPYAAALAAELPRRYEWSYQLAVPSAGVSLSDSLVLVFRPPGGRIAARVAARL